MEGWVHRKELETEGVELARAVGVGGGEGAGAGARLGEGRRGGAPAGGGAGPEGPVWDPWERFGGRALAGGYGPRLDGVQVGPFARPFHELGEFLGFFSLDEGAPPRLPSFLPWLTALITRGRPLPAPPPPAASIHTVFYVCTFKCVCIYIITYICIALRLGREREREVGTSIKRENC